jgi:hypothetical protein
MAGWRRHSRNVQSARNVVVSLLEHWHKFGLPGYAQFDNDNRFTGPRQHRDAIGRVIRVCLSLGVTPVFAIPNETGSQASIENFNGRWQKAVWNRFRHAGLYGLKQRSLRYIDASRQRNAARIDTAPTRRAIPGKWRLNLQTKPRGRIIFLRRTGATGSLDILGHTFLVDRHWVHRMVRAQVDLDQDTIQFHALRRRAPNEQPLLNTVHYKLPDKQFKE